MRAPATGRTTWPKQIAPLSPEEMQILADWRTFWHTELSAKFGIFDYYSALFLKQLARRDHGATFARTLEIGPGITGASTFLDATRTDAVEIDPHFAGELEKRLPSCKVYVGDIQEPMAELETASFDRIVALHVLEHLPKLPAALAQIQRVMKPDAVFDVVIPCEGGFCYSIGRGLTTARHFKRKFHQDFARFIAQDHVNTARELLDVLQAEFHPAWTAFYPFTIPSSDVNLCVGIRLQKKHARA